MTWRSFQGSYFRRQISGGDVTIIKNSVANFSATNSNSELIRKKRQKKSFVWLSDILSSLPSPRSSRRQLISAENRFGPLLSPSFSPTATTMIDSSTTGDQTDTIMASLFTGTIPCHYFLRVPVTAGWKISLRAKEYIPYIICTLAREIVANKAAYLVFVRARGLFLPEDWLFFWFSGRIFLVRFHTQSRLLLNINSFHHPMTSFVNALVVYYYVSRTYCMRAEFVDDVWGIVWSSLSALHKSSHKQFEYFCKMTHKITSNLQSILSQSWIVDHLSLFRRTIACAPVNFLFISTWFVSFVSESIIEFSSFSKSRKVHETAPYDPKCVGSIFIKELRFEASRLKS